MNRRSSLSGVMGLGVAAAFTLLAGVAQPAQADTPVQRPLRFIVPVGPGSGGDTLTRFIAERVAKVTGQPAIVENKPGGDTVVAVQSLMSAPADGSSILMLSPASMILTPLTMNDVPYNPRDIRPVVGVVTAVPALVVPAGSPYKSMTEVLAAARKAPGKLSLASYGPTYEAGAAQMAEMARLSFNYIPYKGASQMMTDLIGGALDVGLVDVGGVLPLLKSGKVRALAVTDKTRHPDLPDVPTVAESGVSQYNYRVWIGFGVPVKTPEPVVKALEAALLQVVRNPDFAVFALQNGSYIVSGQSGEQFAAMLATESERYKRLIAQTNFRGR